MAIDLHYDPISAPCRAVILTAKMVGVELNLKIVSLLAQEQMKPEFIKINPQHTVPVIDDSGFILTESRAICAYLINKYAKNDKLYPKSAKERSVVDQRLYFDLGVFYPGFSDYYVSSNHIFIQAESCNKFNVSDFSKQYPVIFFGATSFDEKKKKSLEDGINYLNMFLNEHDYVACDHFTVADLALTVSAAVMEVIKIY